MTKVETCWSERATKANMASALRRPRMPMPFCFSANPLIANDTAPERLQISTEVACQ